MRDDDADEVGLDPNGANSAQARNERAGADVVDDASDSEAQVERVEDDPGEEEGGAPLAHADDQEEAGHQEQAGEDQRENGDETTIPTIAYKK